jgi:hypothetical protein
VERTATNATTTNEHKANQQQTQPEGTQRHEQHQNDTLKQKSVPEPRESSAEAASRLNMARVFSLCSFKPTCCNTVDKQA